MHSTPPAPLHTHDPDCAATLDADLQCTSCGVSHSGPPCDECGGIGFHADDCCESDAYGCESDDGPCLATDPDACDPCLERIYGLRPIASGARRTL